VNNTIVAGSGAGGEVVNTGTLTGSHDLIGDGSGGPGLTHTISGDPMLGPLAFNGGQMQTMALLPGSPAIAAGNASLIPAGVTRDQRGLIRGGTVDIGAFQSSLVVESAASTV